MNHSGTAQLTQTEDNHAPPVIPKRDRRQPQRESNRNQLLASLPAGDRHRLAGVLRFTSLGAGQILHKEGQPIEQTYFLNGGVSSLSRTMADGGVIELAAVGREGFLGLDAIFGSRVSTCDVSVRVAGDSAYVLSVEAFREEMDRRGAFYDAVTRYAGDLIRVLMQSIACSALHPVKARCARWLLLAQDHLDRNEINVSHETVAMALGVRRPTVTLVLNDLVRSGTIMLQRSRILVVNRAELEAVACECYRLTRT